MPYLLAIASAFFYGAADFTGGLVTRRAAAIPVVLLSQGSGLVLVALILPLLPTAAPRAADMWWGAAAGVAGGVGVALLYHALAIGTMSVVAPTTAVAAVAIPVITSIALGERPGWLAVVGILVGIVAIVLISRQTPSSIDAHRSSGIGPALAECARGCGANRRGCRLASSVDTGPDYCNPGYHGKTRTAMEINFRHDVDQVFKDAKAQRKPVLLDFSAAPM